MAYTPTNWQDRISGNPGQFSTTGSVPGNVVLTLNDSPSQAGTPVTAARMNNIENELAKLDNAVNPTGLTGAIAATRYVGATVSGAPVTGTFLLGDFIVDQTGLMWVCTVAGTPGTWVRSAQTGSQIFTSSGSFTVPAGIYRIFVKVWGGGGGGGAGGTIAYSNTYGTGGGGGGGSGGYAGVWLSVTPAQVITLTIGAGGASGVVGGLTTIGGIIVTGGTQGATGGGNSSSGPGTGGAYGSGGVSNYGTSGVTGNPGTVGGNGGTSTYGAGGTAGGALTDAFGTFGAGGGGGHGGVYNSTAITTGSTGSNGAVVIVW